MSDQPGPESGPPEQELSAEQEQMLRQMEEEMARVRVQDLLGQSVVSILNLTYRRIAKEDEQDLEQAHVGIEAVRALVDHLEEEQQAEVRNALSQVQMAYAQATGGAPPQAGGAPPSGDEGAPPSSGGDPQGGGGPQSPPPGLWVPGR